MKLNIAAGTGEIDNNIFDLDRLRSYLLNNHESLVTKNYIKTIRVKGCNLRCYDWDHIFYIAKTDPDIIEDFKLFINES